MRKLEFQDTFSVSRLLKKTGLSNEIKKLFKEGQREGASMEELGIDAIFSILEAAADQGTEADVYKILGNIMEKEPEEVKHLSFSELKDTFVNIAKENDLINFFKHVSRQMK